MTEDEARAWLKDRFGAEACERVATFLDIVVEENARQNLISPGTIATVWARHAVDSAQLLALAPIGWRTWLDVGTGGGFPGMIVALLSDGAVTMVEPRRKRTDFLRQTAETLGLRNATVIASRVETASVNADIISARAVASVENLLRAARHCAKKNTTWLLPRGQSGMSDASSVKAMFHVEHSLVDPHSVILVTQGIPA